MKNEQKTLNKNNQNNVILPTCEMAPKTIFTLVFVKKNREILLGLKARGFGVGLWNGFGGKVEGNESVFEGAKRELKEESNLEVQNLKQLGVVTYEVENKLQKSVVHIFTASSFDGNLKASEEMNPLHWYNYENIPYQKMWPDAKFWYPLMLNEKCFSALVKYGSDGKIKDKNIAEYSDIDEVLRNVDT